MYITIPTQVIALRIAVVVIFSNSRTILRKNPAALPHAEIFTIVSTTFLRQRQKDMHELALLSVERAKR